MSSGSDSSAPMAKFATRNATPSPSEGGSTPASAPYSRLMPPSTQPRDTTRSQIVRTPAQTFARHGIVGGLAVLLERDAGREVGRHGIAMAADAGDLARRQPQRQQGPGYRGNDVGGEQGGHSIRHLATLRMAAPSRSGRVIAII